MKTFTKIKIIIVLATLAVYSINYTNAQWQQTNGPYTGSIRSLAVIDTNIFAGSYGCGVSVSNNNGASWTSVNNGLTNNYVMALGVGGTDILAGTGDGLFLSTNNGSSWIVLNDSLWVQALAVSGTNIFVGGGTDNNMGVYLSTNNGASWTLVNNGLTDLSIRSIAIFGSNIFVGTNSGVFLSTNNGGLWTAVNNGLPQSQYHSFAAINTNIFTSAWGNGYRVYLSNNNGSSWTAVSNGLPPYSTINSLAVSGSTIFAGTNSFGVFISSDNGNSWAAWNSGGLSSEVVESFVISGTNIYAGTTMGYVWKRPLSDISSSNCSAQFTMFPDTAVLHHYFAVNNASGVPPLTYLWSWDDGTYDTIAYPSHTYSTAGFYNICLFITDSTGCTDTYCETSYLSKNSDAIVSVDVIPNNATGINTNYSNDKFSIYPNPATNYLTIETTQPSQIEILNLQGQIIYKSNTDEMNTSIDVSGFPEGLYMVKIISAKGISVQKFVKE
ncbi:MAG: T9SS type A sorting domain-containing protein [Bacteroidota bacterium]